MAYTTKMHSDIGRSLASSIQILREELGSSFAPITVVVPALPNAGLIRRALATHGPFIRVWFSTPEELMRAAVPASHLVDALPSESGQWMHTVLGHIVKKLKDKEGFADLSATLCMPGWRKPLLNALRTLEHEGIDAHLLQKVVVDVEKERFSLLCELLSQVEQARIQNKIASPNSLAEAALKNVKRGAGVGQAAAHGVIVVGDSTLSYGVFRFLQAWFQERKVLRLALPAEKFLSFAHRGILAAAADADMHFVESSSPQTLQRLHENMGAPQNTSKSAFDEHLVFAFTPDERREKAEAIREVQHALSKGTALDRIALVVPNRKHLDALAASLQKAGIPVTWHVGQPLSELYPARFLRLSLALAQAQASVEQCYHFLTHPLVKLEQALGPKGDEDKAHWRGILGRCGYALGLSRIVQAVQKQQNELVEELSLLKAAPHLPTYEEEKARLEEKQLAAASLQAALVAMNDFITSFQQRVSLAEHAEKWVLHLDKWIQNSQEQIQIKSSLGALQQSRTQFTLSLNEAVEELNAHLTQESPRGRITEAAVKVLSPMQLLGGEFDLVCLLGMTEGSFPAAISEDPLLSDSLIAALNDDKSMQNAGLKLRFSKELAEQERRRLAAVIGSVSNRLWVSIPYQLFDPERPLLPSVFVLDMLSCFLGRAARFTDLEHLVLQQGARSQPICRLPDRALGAAEYLSSRLLLSTEHSENSALNQARIETRNAAISALASHPFGKRILSLHQSIYLVATEQIELNAWTGKVSSDVMPCLGLKGEVLSLWQMKTLMRNPGLFFFRTMLHAYKSASLNPSHPLNSYRLYDEVKAAILAQLQGGLQDKNMTIDALEQIFVAGASKRAKEHLLDELAFAPAPNESELKSAIQEISRSIEVFKEKNVHLLQSNFHSFENLILEEKLPFYVKGEDYFSTVNAKGETELNAFATYGTTTKNLARDEPELVLSAMALSHLQKIDKVTSLLSQKEGSNKSAQFLTQQNEMRTELEQVYDAAQAGLFLVGTDTSFGFSSEKPIVDIVKKLQKMTQKKTKDMA